MANSSPSMIPVILCGGSGTRLWPLSRERFPKQFHPLISTSPLLHDTLKRAEHCACALAADIITVTTDDLKKETIHQLANYDPDTINHILSEPCARNTAAAISLAVLYSSQHHNEDTILWIMPSDHHVEDLDGLSQALKKAAVAATDGHIVTIGIQPTMPSSDYGYIQSGAPHPGKEGIFHVTRFSEKPDKATAEKYLEDPAYLWNSGMFIATLKTFQDLLQTHCPDIYAPLHQDFKQNKRPDINTYNTLPALPFDIAVMEKTDKAAVIPANMGWSDVGSWDSVWNLKDKDHNSNFLSGRVAAIESENCFIQANSLLVAAMGLKDIVIIENDDSILIADKKNSQSMKLLVETLKKMDSPETIDPPLENRPWGQFKVLSNGEGYKVKELRVKPGQKLSRQKHNHRSEFWTVISGQATVTINGQTRALKAQESAFVPLMAEHQLANMGTADLVIIEVQCGSNLLESDIIRFDELPDDSTSGRLQA